MGWMPSARPLSRGTAKTPPQGLTLQALLSVNELDDPDLIHPDQRINLPPPSGGQGS